MHDFSCQIVREFIRPVTLPLSVLFEISGVWLIRTTRTPGMMMKELSDDKTPCRVLYLIGLYITRDPFSGANWYDWRASALTKRLKARSRPCPGRHVTNLYCARRIGLAKWLQKTSPNSSPIHHDVCPGDLRILRLHSDP
jgi:hypothetical protein